jgi:hypothetical protein
MIFWKVVTPSMMRHGKLKRGGRQTMRLCGITVKSTRRGGDD